MRRRALLVQLPIPPAGHAPVKGNVPLAGAYLKMYAELRGRQEGNLNDRWQIDLLPTADANTLGDAALVEAILAREPHLVGFTCYLWNIDRTLWIAERLKARRPELILLVGGPEITADNSWTLNHPAVDYAAIGEILGQVTVLDKAGKVVATFGTNAVAEETANNKMGPDRWRPGVVNAPHGVAFNERGDIFVSEYSLFGRVHRVNRQ